MFHQYLNITENWVFRLIDDLSNTDVVVASQEFKKCNFYSGKFKYLKFPLRKIEHNLESRLVRLFNQFVGRLESYYPWYVSKTARKIDLMHSHFSFVGWEYRELARKLKVPHIVSFYGFDYENLPHIEPAWRERYRTLFAEADLFLCEGCHGTKLLEKMGCPAEKIAIARLGVAVEKIPFYERKKEPGELRLLQVARLVEKKGHIYAVRAFLEALMECPNMSLTLVGSDPVGIKEELLKIIRGTMAEGKVVFIDRIDFDKLNAFMVDYQVFIHPSHYSKDMDSEGGAPVVLLDAQASGLPIISTTHCDIPDEVVHGETGLLCPERDISALAEAITRFYRMGPHEYENFAANARKYIASNYDSRVLSNNLEKIYRKVIAENTGNQ